MYECYKQNLLLTLRRQRLHSVQTELQYIYAHRTLLAYFCHRGYISDQHSAYRSFHADYAAFIKQVFTIYSSNTPTIIALL